MSAHSHAHGHDQTQPALTLPKALLIGDLPPKVSREVIQCFVALRSKGVLLYSMSQYAFQAQKEKMKKWITLDPRLKFDVLWQEGDCLKYEHSLSPEYYHYLLTINPRHSGLFRAYEEKGLVDPRKKNQYLLLAKEKSVEAKEAENCDYKVYQFTDKTLEFRLIKLLCKLEVMESPANGWTKLGAITGGAVDFVTNACLLAAMLMYTMSNEDPEELGYSLSNLAYALPYGLFVAMSTMYCHYVFESQGQNEAEDNEENEQNLREKFWDFKDPHPEMNSLQVIAEGENEDELYAARRISAGSSRSQRIGANEVSLHWYQKIALFGDAFGHMGDLAGPLVAWSRIFGAAQLKTLHQWLINGSIFVLSILGSGADFRTCFMALLKRKDQDEDDIADFWTKWGTGMTFVVEFVNGVTVFSDLFPDFFPERNDFLGYSKEALCFGIPFGFFIAAAGTCCDYLVHRSTQSGQGLMNTRNYLKGVQLPLWKRIILFGDGLCLLTGYASPLILAENICGLDALAKGPRLAITFGTLALTSVGVVSKFLPHRIAVLRSEQESQRRALDIQKRVLGIENALMTQPLLEELPEDRKEMATV